VKKKVRVSLGRWRYLLEYGGGKPFRIDPGNSLEARIWESTYEVADVGKQAENLHTPAMDEFTKKCINYSNAGGTDTQTGGVRP